jgi:hypothetical protein
MSAETEAEAIPTQHKQNQKSLVSPIHIQISQNQGDRGDFDTSSSNNC